MFRGWDAETNFAVEGYLQDPVLLNHIATDSKVRGGGGTGGPLLAGNPAQRRVLAETANAAL